MGGEFALIFSDVRDCVQIGECGRVLGQKSIVLLVAVYLVVYPLRSYRGSVICNWVWVFCFTSVGKGCGSAAFSSSSFSSPFSSPTFSPSKPGEVQLLVESASNACVSTL